MSGRELFYLRSQKSLYISQQPMIKQANSDAGKRLCLAMWENCRLRTTNKCMVREEIHWSSLGGWTTTSNTSDLGQLQIDTNMHSSLPVSLPYNSVKTALFLPPRFIVRNQLLVCTQIGEMYFGIWWEIKELSLRVTVGVQYKACCFHCCSSNTQDPDRKSTFSRLPCRDSKLGVWRLFTVRPFFTKHCWGNWGAWLWDTGKHEEGEAASKYESSEISYFPPLTPHPQSNVEARCYQTNKQTNKILPSL